MKCCIKWMSHLKSCWYLGKEQPPLPPCSVSVSARVCCGTGRLFALFKEVTRGASSVVPCRLPASGCRGLLGTLFQNVHYSSNGAQSRSVSPVHCRERLQNPVWFSPTLIQRGPFHCGWPWAVSDNGTRSINSLEQGDHRTCSPTWERVWVLQPILYRSREE